MPEYRLRIYKPVGVLWQTHRIHAPDDSTAKDKAKKHYGELAAELTRQTDPKIDDPRLERYTLHEGDRLVCERVSDA